MFHAISAHTDFSHIELRAAVVSFLRNNLELFAAFFSEDENIDLYIIDLAKHGTWDDNLVLNICAELLQAPIHVAQNHGVQVIYPAHGHNPPIWVAYDSSEHYDSVFATRAVSQPDSAQQDNADAASLPQNNNSSPPISPHVDENPQSQDLHAWSIMTANITSFNAQQDLLRTFPFDIIALQETRHTAKSQHGFSLMLKKHGYQVVWGKPQPFKFAKSKTHTSTGLNGRPGGVAIVARAQIPMQFVPPGNCPIRKRLYHSCRWVHAVLAYGNCKQTLHIFSIYGFTGHYSHSNVAELNEALLHDVLDVLAPLGPDVPVLILGDINVDPANSPVLSHAITKGLLTDLGHNCGPTFFPTHGNARRLDVALATKAAASALLSIEALPDTGLPGHLPLALKLDIPSFSEQVPRIRRPAAFPEVIPEQVDLAKSILHKHAVPNLSDPDSVYKYFSSVAEEYLVAAAGVISKRFCGCGKIPVAVLEPRFSPQGLFGAGCENVALRRLKRLLRRLEQLQHYFNNNLANSLKARRLWECVVPSRCFLSSHSDLFGSSNFPSPELLLSMIEQLQKSVTSMQAKETSQRVKVARERFQSDWKNKPSNVYSKVDPVLQAPTVLFQTTDGRLTGNFQEIEFLLKKAWLPIFDKYSAQAEPAWSEFEKRYQQYFPSPVSMTLRPFCLTGIRKILQRMKTKSAVGPDAWAVTDLRNLPDCILELLLVLFMSIEESKQWPEALMFGFCSLIPKDPADLSPLGQRPLGIMSVVYRIYCAYRLLDVIQWQDAILHDSQFSFRPGRSCDDVFYDIALAIEESMLSGDPLVGVHFDDKKAFDLVPRNLIFQLSKRLGFSSSLLDVMQNMYTGLKRFFKLPGGHSAPFKSTCGILQGCPLSVVFMNLIVSMWCRAIEAETTARPRAFADDSMILAPSTEVAITDIKLIGEFAMITKQELAPQKTTAWATVAKDRDILRKTKFQGYNLQVLMATKSLGTHL